MTGICDLCAERGPVKARLVAWRIPVFGDFESIDACQDEAACRARIAERGDEWPVLEAGERQKEVAR